MTSTKKNCRRYQKQITLIVSGLKIGSGERLARKHLETCPDCGQYFRELTAIATEVSRLKENTQHAYPTRKLRNVWKKQIFKAKS
jgi:ribosomal protein L32